MLCCNRELTKVKDMGSYSLMLCSCCGSIFRRTDTKFDQRKKASIIVQRQKVLNNGQPIVW